MIEAASARALTLGFLTLGPQALPGEVVAAAAAAGFGAAGLRAGPRRPGDAWPVAEDQGLADLRGVRVQAARAGVRLSSIAGYYLAAETGPAHLSANVRAAQAAGVRLIGQGCFDPDPGRSLSLLRDYAAEARAAGVCIALEFMPMSALRSLAQALALVDRLEAPNVGLLVDALHLARCGATPAELAAVPPERVLLLQLCDAPAVLPEGVSLSDEALHGRLHPGTGGLDLRGLLRAVPPGTEVEVETPVATDAPLPAAEKARRSAAAALALLADTSFDPSLRRTSA